MKTKTSLMLLKRKINKSLLRRTRGNEGVPDLLPHWQEELFVPQDIDEAVLLAIEASARSYNYPHVRNRIISLRQHVLWLGCGGGQEVMMLNQLTREHLETLNITTGEDVV
jgi:hypothetical protein